MKYHIFTKDGKFIARRKGWFTEKWLCYECLDERNWTEKYHGPIKFTRIDPILKQIKEDKERDKKWKLITSENIHKYIDSETSSEEE